MKRQGRNFIILMAVLAVLAAGYLLLSRYNRDRREQETDQVDGEVLLEMDKEDILRFSYVYDGETYVFEKTEVTVEPQESEDAAPSGGETETAGETQAGSGTETDAETGDGSGTGSESEPIVESRWVYAADPSLNLMQSRINAMANKFTRVIAKQTITDVTDLSQYGLEEPCNVVCCESAQGSYTYNVGDYNSVGSVYYICEPGSDTVYAVTTSFSSGMDYSLEELLEQESGEAQ